MSALSGGTERIPVTKISSCYHQLPPPITMPKATLSKPRNLKCTTQDESGLILSWEKPLTFNDLGGYSVFQVRGCDSRPILKAIVSDSKYVLSNLSPGKWYYIKVQANYKKSIIKKNLPELYSETIACKTKEIGKL